MESSIKHCIVNACVGSGWYPAGQARLRKSLNFRGSSADFLAFNNEWPVAGYDQSCHYNIKASAIEHAMSLGYTHILWLDCSVWAVNDLSPIWDVINGQGYYLGMSGYNAAQVCSDSCLDYFQISRDQAEEIADCSSGIFGVNIENPTGREFIERWIQAAKDGVFGGSRLHDGQSQDHRFLFHRQDQSAATIIAGQLGMHLHPPGVYTMPYAPDAPSNLIFMLRGM